MLITEQLRNLARRYAAAWSSNAPANVAACYSTNGSLTVNYGSAASGRAAIAEVAQGFMRDLPDMQVLLDDLSEAGGRVIFHWTLKGTNNGPGGTGKRIHISGFEEWTIGADGPIVQSHGHFDAREYRRQLQQGAGENL